MSCSKTSNNKHFNCPPRMNDGRHFTDYRPHCHIESLIQQQNNIQSSFQSRLFLTQNAEQLMELNRKEACNKNCCGPCQSPYQTSTTMPEAQANVTNASVPCGTKKSVESDINAYSNSPLRCESWDSGVVEVSKNCCTPPNDAANYYPASMSDVIVHRKSVPGGGVQLQGGDPNMYY